MKKQMSEDEEFHCAVNDERQFTLRGFVVGAVGLVIITASSMYVALRMGALPWPTVFVTVLSMAVLGRCKNISLREINVTHTFMSSGSMVAGGLAFTLPGIWIVSPNADVSVFNVVCITLLGAILGTAFSALFRRTLINDKTLIFPIGNAAYQTLVTGIRKGKESVTLFVSMAFSVIFTIIRDGLGCIPAVFTVFAGSSKIAPINVWVSPMATAIGGMIDKMSALFWAIGGFLGVVLLPMFGATDVFRQNSGIGLMIGTGCGILLKTAAEVIKNRRFVGKKYVGRDLIVMLMLCFSAAVVLAFCAEINFLQALVAIIFVCISCFLSGMLTGQSGINPMEVFGILTMIFVGSVAGKTTSILSLFAVAAVTSVACGLSGDVMNDFKSGAMLGTNPKSQVTAEFIGGIFGAFLSVCVLFIMKRSFGDFGTDLLPAPQAKAVASMASGFGKSAEFFVGIIVGTILYLAKIPATTLGLGIYLPIQITIPVAFGALCKFLVCKRNKVLTKSDVSGKIDNVAVATEDDCNRNSDGDGNGENVCTSARQSKTRPADSVGDVCKPSEISEKTVSLICGGLLGGEGIAGVLIAIFSMF